VGVAAAKSVSLTTTNEVEEVSPPAVIWTVWAATVAVVGTTNVKEDPPFAPI